MPQVQPIPGQDQNPFKNGSLLITRNYVDMTVNNSQLNLSNYLRKDELPDLSNYLTTSNDVYAQPQTGPVDLIVVKVPNPDDNKLITKKYLEYVVSDLSTFLTINDTASILDTGHYLSGYDVYNHNNEINPVYYPLNTSGITDDKFRLATQGFVHDLFYERKSK
jgi:hypothetical protein